MSDQTFAQIIEQQAEKLAKTKASTPFNWPSNEGTYKAYLTEVNQNIRDVGNSQHPEVTLIFDVLDQGEAGSKLRASFDLFLSTKRDDGTEELWQAAQLKGMVMNLFGIEEFKESVEWVSEVVSLLRAHVYDAAKETNTVFQCRYYKRQFTYRNGKKAGQEGESNEVSVLKAMSQDAEGVIDD